MSKNFTKEDVIKEIELIDWDQEEHNHESALDIQETLTSICNMTTPSHAQSLGDRIISLIANNHSGIYKTSSEKVIDVLSKLHQVQDLNSAAKICSLSILNDLHYFSPEEPASEEEKTRLERIQEKLKPYSDDRINFPTIENKTS
ncbi:hypothetical protein BFW38_02385 [Terasakiispira papahanaumokuakeensis]|uniref:Uncharacterized protein n=1 Tax=Terasakiispira papahanaumokuakeensis TaxID=197479 RepID=A0A1E2V6G5_9GAMM|nr:hypothetical protein [Terasakiispira papahanaumokuakeensis]ODC02564.1 hypothetical protein BFW38_02385 [Terasakiispira papahanaumokuakeensis]